MSTRKSMSLPIIITLIIIVIIVYLFATLKQSEIVCEKTSTFDADIRLTETVISSTDGKKITRLYVSKEIVLPDKYSSDDATINGIKYALDNTLSYLDKSVKYKKSDNSLTIIIDVSKNELVLLDNVSFIDNDNLEIQVDSNTKSSNVVALSVGDNYTDGELKKRLRNNGYSCR